LAVRHRARTGRSRAAENELQVSFRNLREGGQSLMIQMKTKLLSVENYRAADIFNLVSDAPKTSDEILQLD
jgi:hypothetical protein